MGANVPNSEPSGDFDRKGSVKRARQLLEAGVRPERASPPHQMRPPPVPRNVSHQTQWPLSESGLPPHPINQPPRYMLPRGGPPQRLPQPSQIPSPSIYSERDGQDSEANSIRTSRPPRSVSSLQPPPPLQLRQPITHDAPASPTSTVDAAPRISIATDDLFRQSTASSTISASDVPPVPLPFPPAESSSQDYPKQRTAGLVAPPNTRRPARARQSSVPPIPEQISGPRCTKGSFASSRVIPSSWGSGPAESEILGAGLDMEADEHARPSMQEDDATLVRSASLGKRGKPTMRTIMKSSPISEVSVVDSQAPTKKSFQNQVGAPILGESAANHMLHPPTQLRNASISTASSDSLKGLDPEKPPFSQQDPPYSAGLEKEIGLFGALPMAAPTMSDKRPWGRKPPALNMHALRDAEARGSLSSLTDLIRRATKLASNLDHGRTASRADVIGGGEAEFKAGKGDRARGSGSISDMLASFPPPGLATPESRGSWPVFFGRSNLRNVEPLGSNDDGPDAPPRKKTCCGMPRRLFLLICIILFIVVILAVLLPVFLVAVPREKASKEVTCADTNPCENGGVSVSSGSQCSCVCSNGYTGSKCTIASDGSCTTALIHDSTSTKNATMGSGLPQLFEDSKAVFDLTLDPVTIMGLFSMNDVSCKTENSLVSFSEVPTSSSRNARRSLRSETENIPSADYDYASPAVPAPTVNIGPTPVLAARSERTMNGILYDDTESSQTAAAAPATQTDPPTASATKISFQPTSTREAKTPTATSVPENVVEFSRIAVLYILQKTGSLDTAMSSAQDMQGYLIDSYSSTAWPTMVVGSFEVDFENLTITLPNSKVKAD